jgi:hypothetical protein
LPEAQESHLDHADAADNQLDLTDDGVREETDACVMRDQIAQQMWEDYQRMLHERGLDLTDPFEIDEDDDGF